MIEVSRTETQVHISIEGHSVALDHARAHLLASRLQHRGDITMAGDGGSVVYRTPLFGADYLAIADRFLDHQAVRVELDDTMRGRLIKNLSTL